MTRKSLLAALLAVLGVFAVVAIVIGGRAAATGGDHCPDGQYNRGGTCCPESDSAARGGGHDPCEPPPCPTADTASRGGHHDPCEPTPTEPTPTEPTPTEPTPTEPTPTEPTEPPEPPTSTEPPPTEPPSVPNTPPPSVTSDCVGGTLVTTTVDAQGNISHSYDASAVECDRQPGEPPQQEEGM